MGTYLTGRTVLIASAGSQRHDLATELEQYGARVLTWPNFEPTEPESYTALDDAIDNLYGYDWLIFTTVSSVEYFLRRLEHLGREIQELDSIRVCAITEATVRQLEHSQVHIDLGPPQFTPAEIFAALVNYAGGASSLHGLNFLIPRALIARDHLKELLEDCGARVDVVATYRAGSNSQLTRINTLLAGGGIDCVVFTAPSTVREFAQLFDTNDLSELFANVAVACFDATTSRTVAEYRLHLEIRSNDNSIAALASAIAAYFAG